MQINFPPLHFTKVIIISLLLSFPLIRAASESVEKAKQELLAAQEKTTKRFAVKLSQTQTHLETYAAALKTEPLHNELETAIHALHKEPPYQLYKLTKETCTFIQELGDYNKTVIHSKLLVKINDLVERLKNYETFTSLRSTLKKQRVALLELFEEKELILSVEKILKYQSKELSELLTEQQKTVLALPTYQHAQEVQKKYLKTKAVKTVQTCIEKKRELLLQQQSALLKSKEYQKALHNFELLSFCLPTTQKQQREIEALTKEDLLNLQHELFIVPLENTI